MDTHPLTAEELVGAFTVLGGEAEWRDVRKQIASGRSHPYAPYKDRKNFETTLWQLLYQRCPGSGKFTGNKVFEKIGKTRYRLADFISRDSTLPTSGPGELGEWEDEVLRVRLINERSRNQNNVARILEIYNSTCQCCGIKLMLPSGEAYAEAHHIRGLGDGGPDNLSNILCLCANCHALFDLKAIHLSPGSLNIAQRHILRQEFLDHHNSLFSAKWTSCARLN
jgi:HNH endonuclease